MFYHTKPNTVTVAGKNGKKLQAAVEDVRYAAKDESIAQMIPDGIDECSNCIDDAFDQYRSEPANIAQAETQERVQFQNSIKDPEYEPDFSSDENKAEEITFQPDHMPEWFFMY